VSRLEIACAAEGRAYVAHCAAMLHSALTAPGGAGARVHFMHGPDLRPRDVDALAGMVRGLGGAFEPLLVGDERLAGLPTRGFTRKATWYRVFLPELRPDVDRALYLDADLLVLDDLRELWGTDLAGAYLGAVTNVFERHYLGRPAELGLAGPEVYFNAGVLLLDLDRLRADGCSRALIEYGVANRDRLLWRDQDALNVVLGHRRAPLHPRWNCMNAVLSFPWADEVFGAEAVAEARRRPAIRHFEGPDANKPWHVLCDAASRALYLQHRRATPWPRLRLQGRTPRNLLRAARRPVSA
jgi:lipopolysaccharide biosynthesis glycosyltransferase